MRQDALHRNQFTFYRSFRDALKNLPRSQREQVMEALMDYALDGILPADLHGSGAAVFALLQPVIDSSRTKAANRSRADETPYHYAEWDSPEDGSVPDSVRDKKENKNKNKKKIENKIENKIEKEREGKEEEENESGAGRGGSLPSEEEKPDSLFRAKPLSPIWDRATAGIPGLAAAVRDYLDENAAGGRPFTLAEEGCLCAQLLQYPDWERLSAVERAAEERRRSFLPGAPPGGSDPVVAADLSGHTPALRPLVSVPRRKPSP